MAIRHLSPTPATTGVSAAICSPASTALTAARRRRRHRRFAGPSPRPRRASRQAPAALRACARAPGWEQRDGLFVAASRELRRSRSLPSLDLRAALDRYYGEGLHHIARAAGSELWLRYSLRLDFLSRRLRAQRAGAQAERRTTRRFRRRTISSSAVARCQDFASTICRQVEAPAPTRQVRSRSPFLDVAVAATAGANGQLASPMRAASKARLGCCIEARLARRTFRDAPKSLEAAQCYRNLFWRVRTRRLR